MPAEILQGLQNFNQYLTQENARKKQEWEEKKAAISAGRIAESFKTLTADHTERDARTLMYDVIKDAASLDSLQENVGLIQALYSDSMKGIESYKKAKQDKAYFEYAASLGYTNLNKDLGGEGALNVVGLEKQYESKYEEYDKKGVKYATTYDARGNERRRIVLDPRTKEEKEAEELELYEKKERIRSRYTKTAQPRFQPLTGPQGQLTSFNPFTGQYFEQVTADDGQTKLVPYTGQAYKIGALKPGDITDIKAGLDLTMKTIKQAGFNAGSKARSILDALDISLTAGPDNKPALSAQEYLRTRTWQEIDDLIKSTYEDNPEKIEQLRTMYAEYQTADAEYEAATGSYQYYTDALTKDTVKKGYGIEPAEYDEIANAINEYVKDVDLVDIYRNQSYVTQAKRDEHNTAMFMIQAIRSKYQGSDKAQLEKSKDYMAMFDQLPAQDKGAIMKAIKEASK